MTISAASISVRCVPWLIVAIGNVAIGLVTAAEAPITVLADHVGRVRSVAITPDGRSLIALADDKNPVLRFLNLREDTVEEIQLPADIGSASLSATDKAVAVASGNTVNILDIGTKKWLPTKLQSIGAADEVLLSPDSRLVAVTKPKYCGREIELWDVANGNKVTSFAVSDSLFLATMHHISQFVFSPDGTSIAAAYTDRVIRIWRVGGSGPMNRSVKTHDAASAVAWSPDGKCLASCGYDGKLEVWDAGSGELRETLTANSNAGRLSSIAWSPNGKLIAAGDDRGAVTCWRLSSASVIAESKTHRELVIALAFSRDGMIIFSAGADGATERWDYSKRSE